MPIELPPGTATHSDRNPEVSHHQLFRLLVIVVGFIMGAILLVNLLVNAIVWWIPPSAEKALGQAMVRQYDRTAQLDPSGKARQTYLNQLIQQLNQKLPTEQQRDFQLLYVPESVVNAAAVPGNYILLFDGLLKQATSENELVMVLGHELGHFTNRDHLRALGNVLLLQIAIGIITGGDASSWTAAGAASVGELSRAQFSQKQERQADEVGLTLLNAYYGHAAGATDFFDRISQKTRAEIALLASHPTPKSRVQDLKNLIRQRGYTEGDKKPLDPILRGY
ncbi:MAG: M48 family metallopeptidase [Synechococcales bacterium]|nr:M48 family metallopeptidase [Synechococcales bacterium]